MGNNSQSDTLLCYSKTNLNIQSREERFNTENKVLSKLIAGRAKVVGSGLEHNTTELTHPGTEATTGTTEYKHSTLKATFHFKSNSIIRKLGTSCHH